jgi:hypothetical protein
MGDPRFAAWWDGLPRSWQDAIMAALAGGAAECELLYPDRSPALYVFFVPPSAVPAVRHVLTSRQ